MKHTKKLLLAALLILPLFVVGTVQADEQNSTTHQTTTTPKERKTGNEGLTLQQRLDKYKADVKARLSNNEKTRVQIRCKAAQGKVSQLKGRITGLKQKRESAYGNLLDHLTELKDKLKAQGIDTTLYEQQVVVLQTKVDTYQTDIAKYEEAVNDLAAMDCAADPDAFKASLETARKLRLQVVQDGLAIREYLANTIKPMLQTLRAQLEQTNTGEEG